MQNSFNVVFENNDLFVIDKPSGIVVNRSDTTNGNTLQDLIEKQYPINTNEDPEFKDRSGIVHRLDKETSGCLVIAKNSIAFKELQAQFKERKVEKEYIALAHGELKPVSGEINFPVGRLPWNRKRFGVLAGGREAVTSYQVISNYELPETDEVLSYVRLFPKTGRTHQIRVHLRYLNHPIFGDELYAGRKVAKQDRLLLQRIFLHAEKISFFDPKSLKRIDCVAPLPIELMKLLENLKPINIIK